MAKNKDKAAAPAAAEETTAAKAVRDGEYLNGKVNSVHQGHADYIKQEFGVDVDPAHIFAVYSTRVAYRKTSDQYQGAKTAKVEAREAAEKAKEEAKAKKEAEKKAAAEQKAADKAAAAKTADAEKPAKGKGKGKQSSAEALAEADAPDPEASAKPAKAAAKKSTPAKGKKPF